MSEYITDPTLLAELNGTTSEGYVTDPALLEQLNKKSVKQRVKEEVRSVADQGFTGVTDIANRGLVGGILGSPVDLLNLGVKGVHALTNAAMSPFGYENKWKPSEAPVGGGEWFGQQMQNMGMVSPERRPILETAAGLAPIAPSAVKGAYNLGKAAVNVPVDVAKGALMNKPGTSLVPIEGNQIYKPEAVDRYMKGYLTKAELQQPENMMPLNKMQQAAVRLSGNQVPTKGKIGEATGERLYQDYTNPISLLTDIGTTAITGIPFHGVKRVGQAAIDAGLSKNLKLDPAFKAKFDADVGGAAVPPKGPPPPPAPPAGGAVAPTVNYNTPAYQRQGQQIPGVNAPQTPAQSNAAAMGITPPMTAVESGFTQQLNTMASGPAVPRLTYNPTMYASESGVVGRNLAEVEQAALQQKYAPQPVNGPAIPTKLPESIPEPTVQRVAPTPIRNTGPHENTQAIEQALTTKVAANPALEEFTKTYAKHPSVAQPINDFLSGNTKDAVVYGAPGTGKTFLTREWKNQNPTGEIQTIERQTFDAAKLKELKDRSLLVDVPTLYRVEEANTLTPKQVEMLNDLQKSTTRNGRMVITTNDYKALDPSLKGGNIAQINMNVVLTPEQRSTYALKVAKDYNVNKTPAEIEAIAQNPNNMSYRKIKDEVSAGYSNKETPWMTEHGDASDALAGKLPNNVLKELDDWNNNLSNNLVIFKNPSSNISKALDSWVPQTSDINVIESALYKNTTASPVFRFVVRSEKDAKDISKLKNAISDSNETKFPTKLIVEDYTGNLDPAIISRGKTYTDKDLANTQQVNKPNPFKKK